MVSLQLSLLITFIELYLLEYAYRTSGAPKSTITFGLISLSTSNIYARNLPEYRSLNVLYTSPYYASGSKSAIKATRASRKHNRGLQESSSLVIQILQSWNSGRQGRKRPSYPMQMAMLHFPTVGAFQQRQRRSSSVRHEKIIIVDWKGSA